MQRSLPRRRQNIASWGEQMNTFFIRWPGFRKKALTLSYDDGVVQDKRLAQIMDQHGIKGTFNLDGSRYSENPKPILKRASLNRAEALALYNTPSREVALHSYTHPFLEQLPGGNAAYEVIKDREALEEMFGCIVRGMAYPMGSYDDDLVQTLRQCGVAYARTIKSTFGFDLPADWLRWHPTCHHRSAKMPELRDKFLEAQIAHRPSQLFYLWGHSYEFDEDDNWNLIEEFCEKMGGRDDIWYATNMDIYEYLTAAQSIVASADGRRLYNPTAMTLYLETETEQILLQPGETKLI